MSTNKVFVICAVVVLTVAYGAGYLHAKKSSDLEFANFKLELADKFNKDLLEEQKKYEAREKNLIASFNSDIVLRTERMRQLEQKLQSKPDCQKVTGERNRALELATRGEELLLEARRFIEAMK